MYMDKSLTLSTSVPLISNLPQRVTQSFVRPPSNPLENNSARALNENRGQPTFQAKKMDNTLTFSKSFQPNESFQNKKYNVAQSHIQNESNQYRFQFKRHTLNSSRPNFKQDGLSDKESQFRNIGGSQLVSSNIYAQTSVNQSFVSNGSSRFQNNNKPFKRPEQYEKEIKDLNNQLRFEEKYANDLYKTSEQAKKQASAIKLEKIQLQEKIAILQKKNQDLTEGIEDIRKLYNKQKQMNSELQSFLLEKNERIAIFQNIQSNNKQQIMKLKETIDNFTAHYRNELYEERIKRLNEELIQTNASLAQSVIQKNQLMEQLKAKNEKILHLAISSPTKNKEPIMKSINVSQKTNQAIKTAFEESISVYQRNVQDLKNTIEQQNQEHRKLREEIVQHKKLIESLKEEGKITVLKATAEKNQMLLEKDSGLTEKANQIKTLTNRLNMLEERYNKSLRQINEKDQFLQQHLVGRAKDLDTKGYIQQIMQEYVQTFQSRFALQQRVKALQKQLQACMNQ